MKTLITPSITRVTAALCVTAGLLTGALWSYVPKAPIAPARAAIDAPIDPSIPSVTIIAKRLTPAEKGRMASEDHLTAGAEMLDVSGAAVALRKNSGAF
ncbi:MAG: hypothetical protein H7244_08190 [Herminiimonas sp.]|nr:hypothetical protein [Herminiimonas sp.]